MRLEMLSNTSVKSVKMNIFDANIRKEAFFPKVGEWVTQCVGDWVTFDSVKARAKYLYPRMQWNYCCILSYWPRDFDNDIP